MAQKYPVQTLPVPKTAQTLVHITGNTIAQGGVSMALKAFTDVPRAANPTPKPAEPEPAMFAAARQRPETEWFLAVKK